MKHRIILVLLIACVLITSNLYAQVEGCLVGNTSTGTIYGGPFTLDNNNRRIYSNSQPYPLNCPTPANPSVVAANNLVRHPTNNLRCRVTGTGNNNRRVYSYDLVQCPIDDHELILVLMITGIGYFLIRNASLKLC